MAKAYSSAAYYRRKAKKAAEKADAASAAPQVEPEATAAPTAKQDDHYERQFGHEEGLDREEAAEFTAELLGIDEKQAAKYNEVVYDFTDLAYSRIRKFQRGEAMSRGSLALAKKEDQLLEEYLQKAPRWDGGETYRGVRSDTLPNVGDIIDMGGSSSWTSDVFKADEYAFDEYGTQDDKRYGIVYASKTNTRGTSVRHLSRYANEQEVVVSKSAKYRVVSVSVGKYGIADIELEELR